VGKKKLVRLEENPILMVTDNGMLVMCMIVKGIKGEQHKVFTFNLTKREPLFVSGRAGNTDLEFNMNSHVRPLNQIFICQTESNGAVSAKQVTVVNEEDADDALGPKLPPISFTRPERGYAKDCWLVKEDADNEDEVPLVMTICKSSTDEYLNADCMISEKVLKNEQDSDDDDDAAQFKCKLNSTKIRAQQIDLNYPCLVANVGLSRLMIQSLTNPDKVSSFNLDNAGMEFICFVDYVSLNDIGFVDKRDALEAEIVPFSETGDKIAFMTRKFGVCENKCEYGDMLLNVLSVDSYSTPMKFELFTTTYEACMDEGMNDDSINKCIAMAVTSARGLDVSFIAQYNDRIIFDCITSTKQLPVRFPLPSGPMEEKVWREKDPDFKKSEG